MLGPRITFILAVMTGVTLELTIHAATGRRDVLADGASLTPKGAASPLTVDGYSWSPDRKRALIFTNTRKVWRQNTRLASW